jgi:hypothetical protein
MMIRLRYLLRRGYEGQESYDGQVDDFFGWIFESLPAPKLCVGLPEPERYVKAAKHCSNPEPAALIFCLPYSKTILVNGVDKRMCGSSFVLFVSFCLKSFRNSLRSGRFIKTGLNFWKLFFPRL